MPGGLVNIVHENRLWDRSGREWTCRRTQWADCGTARSFCGRTRPAGVHGFDGVLRWVEPAELATLWDRIGDHWEVPGSDVAEANAEGETFGGHVWRSGDDRMLVVQVHCRLAVLDDLSAVPSCVDAEVEKQEPRRLSAAAAPHPLPLYLSADVDWAPPPRDLRPPAGTIGR
ncbi:MAG: hypothetical protein ACT4QF_21505 [Sporichthyaceae bacterium]